MPRIVDTLAEQARSISLTVLDAYWWDVASVSASLSIPNITS
jgi:hypothetical protein